MIVVLALLLLASPARADEMDRMQQSPHTEESEWIFGLKASVAAVQAADPNLPHPAWMGGAGLFAETTLIPGWMELEIGATLLGDETDRVLAFEPLLKKPFHLDEHLDLYLAIGPVLGLGGMQSISALWAALGVVGCYLWIDERTGIDLELTGMVGSRGGLLELEASFGVSPVLRL